MNTISSRRSTCAEVDWAQVEAAIAASPRFSGRSQRFILRWIKEWVSSGGLEVSGEGFQERFLKELEERKQIADWQVRQADTAVRWFMANRGWRDKPNRVGTDKEKGNSREHLPGLTDNSEGAAEEEWRTVQERGISTLRMRDYQKRTERTYLGWWRRFSRFVGRVGTLPAAVSTDDVCRFLTEHAVAGQVAASTQKQAFNAVRFLLLEVLDRPFEKLDRIVRAKRHERVPVVLSQTEVCLLFGHSVSFLRPESIPEFPHDPVPEALWCRKSGWRPETKGRSCRA